MPDLLSIEDVLFLDADQVRRFGGHEGVRDLDALESAIAQPQATFVASACTKVSLRWQSPKKMWSEGNVNGRQKSDDLAGSMTTEPRG